MEKVCFSCTEWHRTEENGEPRRFILNLPLDDDDRKWPITEFNVKTGNKTRACYDCPLLGGLVFYLPCVVAQIENNLA